MDLDKDNDKDEGKKPVPHATPPQTSLIRQSKYEAAKTEVSEGVAAARATTVAAMEAMKMDSVMEDDKFEF